MRCDTHKDNKIMQHTLEKNGYKYCGVIYLDNGDARVAYEKLI
jgi:RimJ/RimL family protein N-acetyltransferase